MANVQKMLKKNDIRLRATEEGHPLHRHHGI